MRTTRASVAHRLAVAMVSTLAMSFTGAAPAQSAAPSRAANLYVGLAVGESDAEDMCNGVADCDKRDNTFGAFAGYRVHRNFAIEVGYHNLGEITAPGGTYIRSNVWELLVVGSWMVTPPLSIYGKLGPYRGAQTGGGVFASEKNLVNAVTYGVGAQFDVSKNVGLRAELQNYPSIGSGPVLPHGDISVVRLAGLWRFQ
jgi:hypothetical protein